MNSTKFRNMAVALRTEKELLDVQLSVASIARSAVDVRKDYLEEARQFVSQVGIDTQQSISTQIEDLVTLVLQGVYGDTYSFVAEHSIKNNRPNIAFRVKKNDIVFNPKTEMGGGILDLVGFGLRMALWSFLSDPSRVMILDEPFRFVGSPESGLVPKISEMLNTLHEITGIQFIIVTHNSVLAEGADKYFTVHQDVHGVSSAVSSDYTGETARTG